MLGLKEDFLTAINGCQWFKHCGNEWKDEIDFKVKRIKTIENASNSISSLKWENLCLKKDGDFTAYLFLNHRDLYCEFWNDMVDRIKKNYLVSLSETMEAKLQDNGLGGYALSNVEYNVLELFMLNYYSDYYKDEFYEKMLKIYLSGHLPCGWVGSLKTGTFLVY